MVRKPSVQSGVPLVINILMVKVNTMIKKIGFKPFKINFSGTPDTPIISASVRLTGI
jgi:hypothetical protein